MAPCTLAAWRGRRPQPRRPRYACPAAWRLCGWRSRCPCGEVGQRFVCGVCVCVWVCVCVCVWGGGGGGGGKGGGGGGGGGVCGGGGGWGWVWGWVWVWVWVGVGGCGWVCGGVGVGVGGWVGGCGWVGGWVGVPEVGSTLADKCGRLEVFSVHSRPHSPPPRSRHHGVLNAPSPPRAHGVPVRQPTHTLLSAHTRTPKPYPNGQTRRRPARAGERERERESGAGTARLACAGHPVSADHAEERGVG